MEKIFIYGIYDINYPNKIRYVGKTKKNIEQRLKQHVYLSKKNIRRPINLWLKKLLDEGSYPKIKILEETNDKEWAKKEMFWIKKLKKNNNLLNLTDGGESNLNYIHSQETRKKISENTKNGNSHRGKTYEDLYGDKAKDEKEKRSSSVKSGWEKMTKEEKESPYKRPEAEPRNKQRRKESSKEKGSGDR